MGVINRVLIIITNLFNSTIMYQIMQAVNEKYLKLVISLKNQV